jgi:hypothetical protein
MDHIFFLHPIWTFRILRESLHYHILLCLCLYDNPELESWYDRPRIVRPLGVNLILFSERMRLLDFLWRIFRRFKAAISLYWSGPIGWRCCPLPDVATSRWGLHCERKSTRNSKIFLQLCLRYRSILQDIEGQLPAGVYGLSNTITNNTYTTQLAHPVQI